MTCQRCGGETNHYDHVIRQTVTESISRCPVCGWQSNFATQRAECEEVTEWVYDEGDDDA